VRPQSLLKMNPLAIAALAFALAGCASHETKSVSEAAIVTAAAPAKACVPPPSEMVVKDLAPGSGDTARFRSAILVEYTGWLYDGCAADFKGAEFDSSVGKQPISFMLGAGRVIRGWDEGLIGIKEGGKRLLIIPPDKGYGAAGAPGGKIPPNSTLVFEATLVKIIMQAQ
jgi:FKBP-type peptidyl-prolyl cis-trans isomerase FkpA